MARRRSDVRRAGSGRPAGSLAEVLEKPGAPLLVLRAFLGVTFCFASLQKLANPNFFRRDSPGSFYSQTVGAIATSPLHHLLGVATHAPTLFAVLISAGELAVGVGTLAGLFGRAAALGGMVLSLTFFLTVSFNDSPYYYGADIVFLFAWTPLAIAGPGYYSLDGLFARRRAEAAEAARGARRELERRVVLEKGLATAGLAAGAAVLAALVAGIGRRFAPAGTKSSANTLAPGAAGSTTTTTTPAGSNSTNPKGPSANGTEIGPASSVPVGGAATFTDPKQQIPAYVVQPTAGHYVAFSAICTHAGCTVEFDQSAGQFVCPCHGSVFNVSTGAVVSGPAPLPLPSIPVALGPNGALYADG